MGIRELSKTEANVVAGGLAMKKLNLQTVLALNLSGKSLTVGQGNNNNASSHHVEAHHLDTHNVESHHK